MKHDTASILLCLPWFLWDQKSNTFINPAVGRRYLGSLTIKQFVKLSGYFTDQIAVTPKEKAGLKTAFEKGLPTAPAWIRILEASKEWGIPPWEVAEDGLKELWFKRFDIVTTIQAEVARKKANARRPTRSTHHRY